ncbi:MAG TPA: fatty acid desaturase [Chitinophagaceae bacterium]
MRSVPELITDPVYEKPIRLTSYQKFWLKYIHDKRDLPFIRLLTIVHLTIVPVAILLFTPFLGRWWWPVAIVYFYFSQFYFKGSFGLMLHCICHRKFFKPKSKFLDKYLYWFVCPLFGHLGESYHIHHMGMHHIENNMPDDTSSTMGYTRDSFRDFMRYWLKFIFLGFHDAFVYLFERKRKKMYTRLTASEIGFLVIATALCFFNFRATLIVFIIPFLFARLVMMIGNWAQHAFVDPDEPDNDLASNIICLNTSYNHKCWNDGYHAIHHLRPGAHYTDIPLLFRQMVPDFEKNRTFIFEKIHYLHIFYYLMRKRYDKLADYMININGTFSDKSDALELLKRRTRKFKSFVQNKPGNTLHAKSSVTLSQQ